MNSLKELFIKCVETKTICYIKELEIEKENALNVLKQIKGKQMPRQTKEIDERLKDLPKKLQKALAGDDEFLDKAQHASKKELDDLCLKSTELLVDFEKDMDADADLQSLKEQSKEAAAVYKEGIKINKARAAYCVYIKKSL